MKNNILIFLLLALSITAAYFFFFYKQTKPITNFDECVEAGNPIMESYPAQCHANNQVFTQYIGNEIEKIDLIHIDSPRPNELIESPLIVQGQARGTWFFEANFQVRLLDVNGVEIGSAIAEAQTDWMTEEFVPYKATLHFEPSTEKGTLELIKSNPSGLPENSDTLIVPVTFR